MRSLVAAVCLCTLLLISCVDEKTPVPIEQTAAPVQLNRFGKYGAVYEYDEYRINPRFSPDEGCSTFFHINQKLHILTQRGVKYGTLSLPYQQGVLMSADIKVIDKTGDEQQIDPLPIKKKYKRSRKIIIPRVEPGCQILIRLTFRDESPLFNFEHFFNKDIPVINARFLLAGDADLKYIHKTYGNVTGSKIRSGADSGFEASCSNLLPVQGFGFPEADIHYSMWFNKQSPRVVARLKRLNFRHMKLFKAHGWEELAKVTRESFMSPSIFSSISRIEALTSDVIKNAKTEFEKADRILAHVQNNYTLESIGNLAGFTMNTDRVLNKKRGNQIEICVILKQMLIAAGFSPRVYATRPNADGGFDPEFPSWFNLVYDFVVVKIDGKDHVGYFYIPGLQLGEYPFYLAGEKALDIDTGTIVDMPPAPFDNAVYSSTVHLPLDSPDHLGDWRFNYGNHLGVLLRSDMVQQSKVTLKERFKRVLDNYDEQLELVSAALENGNRGEAIEVKVGFKYHDFETRHTKGTHFSLKPFFKKYLTDFEKYTRQSYTNPVDFTIRETVVIDRNGYPEVKVNFASQNIYNSLFDAEFEQVIDENTITLKRRLTLKKANLAPGDIHAFKDSIHELNRISESHIIASR